MAILPSNPGFPRGAGYGMGCAPLMDDDIPYVARSWVCVAPKPVGQPCPVPLGIGWHGDQGNLAAQTSASGRSSSRWIVLSNLSRCKPTDARTRHKWQSPLIADGQSYEIHSYMGRIQATGQVFVSGVCAQLSSKERTPKDDVTTPYAAEE